MADPSTPTPAPALSGARVLVVDDLQENVDMLSRRLRRRGYEVDTAMSGVEALEAITAHSYDAILLDIMMPEMSGLEVLEEVRKHYTKNQLPVLMATARTESRDVVAALKLGANDYVTKPIDFPVVVARLETAIATKREFETLTPSTLQRGTEDFTPGTILDTRYELDRIIGEGGFAVVYKAKQLSTGQPVAVKLLRSQRVADPNTQLDAELARFEREMRLIGEVQHPAVVRLIDSGAVRIETPTDFQPVKRQNEIAETVASLADNEDSHPRAAGGDGPATVPYFVMELLEGETLAQLLARDHRIEIDAALEIVIPVLGGVHSMHERGVIHRDLKPSNIFLSKDSVGSVHPKVLDFGIAKLTREGASDLTTDVAFIGTPTYMSPEQAMGARDLDSRADQYTLAAVLYECLAGRRLYDANGYMHLLMCVAEASVVPIRKSVELPASLDEAIMRALSKDPTERYGSLVEFGLALLAHGSDGVKSRFAPLLGI